MNNITDFKLIGSYYSHINKELPYFSMSEWEEMWENVKLPARCQVFKFTYQDTYITEDVGVRRITDSDNKISWLTKINWWDKIWIKLDVKTSNILNQKYVEWNKINRDKKFERILK